MRHWGLGTYHGEGGTRLVESATEADRQAAEAEGANGGSASPTSPMAQQPLPGPDLPLFPHISEHVSPMSPSADEHIVPIDPSMQHIPQAGADAGPDMTDPHQRQEIMHRLQTLEMERTRMEQEMERLRNALYTG
jgi:hypothetical protein